MGWGGGATAITEVLLYLKEHSGDPFLVATRVKKLFSISRCGFFICMYGGGEVFDRIFVSFLQKRVELDQESETQAREQ